MNPVSRQQTNFQRNLRRACESFGTIAEFCRAAEINRQQFNKYLAGTATPNIQTLKKICSVIGTTADKLFADANSRSPETEPEIISIRKLLNFSSRISLDPGILPQGLYFCYESVPGRQDVLMKSLLVIRNLRSHLQFVRLTEVKNADEPSFALVTGRHSGIVCANETDIFLLGANRYPPHQVSLMTLDKSFGTNSGFYSGLLLTRFSRSQACMNVHVQPVARSMAARQAITSLGVISKSEIDPRAILLSGRPG